MLSQPQPLFPIHELLFPQHKRRISINQIQLPPLLSLQPQPHPPPQFVAAKSLILNPPIFDLH